MNKPIVIERFVNGEHSHWDVVDSITDKTLWYGHPDERPVSLLDIDKREFPELYAKLHDDETLCRYKDTDEYHPEHLYSPYHLTDIEELETQFSDVERLQLQVVFKRCEDRDCSYFRFII